MKDLIEPLDNIQFDHSRWLNEAIFAEKEIALYQQRLLELLKNNREKKEEITTLFDDFDQEKKLANIIKSKIRKQVIHIGQLAHSNGELKTMIDSGHSEVREEMENFRQQYATLKENFHRFSALQN